MKKTKAQNSLESVEKKHKSDNSEKIDSKIKEAIDAYKVKDKKKAYLNIKLFDSGDSDNALSQMKERILSILTDPKMKTLVRIFPESIVINDKNAIQTLIEFFEAKEIIYLDLNNPDPVNHYPFFNTPITPAVFEQKIEDYPYKTRAQLEALSVEELERELENAEKIAAKLSKKSELSEQSLRNFMETKINEERAKLEDLTSQLSNQTSL